MTALLAIHVVVINDYQEFVFREQSGVFRVAPIVSAIIPLFLFYGFLRLFSFAWLAALISAATTFGLSFANAMKSSLTGDPLSFTDLSTTVNLSIVFHYLNTWQIASIGIALALMLLCLLYSVYRLSFVGVRRYAVSFLAILAIGSFAVPSPDTFASGLSHVANEVLAEIGVDYIDWDWTENIRMNGLTTHLIQTSERRLPPKPTTDENAAFARLSLPVDAASTRPRKIIFVLCESCWNDGNNFRELYQPLTDNGFQEFRAISPVYGGGTVNTSFEMLTGLPADSGVLTGIIYQEYNALLSKQAHSMPRYLKKLGYQTIAMHNNKRKFWFRDVVNPKMGFDRFISLEDMGYSPPVGWADDAYLFNSALELLRLAGDQPLLLTLTSVYTHGSYPFVNDFGEGDYTSRLKTTLERMVDFVSAVNLIDPNALIIIYGDHKPSLTRYFYERGVFPRSAFAQIGETNEDFRFDDAFPHEIKGDVPVYIRYPGNQSLAHFKAEANGLPFFCLSEIVDRYFIHSGLPAHTFSTEVCKDYRQEGYEKTVKRFPSWLYALSVIDPTVLD